jgi:hypothetical protein
VKRRVSDARAGTEARDRREGQQAGAGEDGEFEAAGPMTRPLF